MKLLRFTIRKTKDRAQGRWIELALFLLLFFLSCNLSEAPDPIIYHLWFYSHRFHPLWPLAPSSSLLVSFSMCKSVCTCTVGPSVFRKLLHEYRTVCMDLCGMCVCGWMCVYCAGCSVKYSGHRLFFLSALKGQSQCKKDGLRSEQYTRRLAVCVCMVCVCLKKRESIH